mmetsp:Transcript_15538/g.47228  ORF Transcript_15538/g.47228 Transcript_15538/m.47228 type:complete len:99 (+) Transcript_15538:522-818(+)|eukprot:scaffold307485_cov31-Tisochrysis_lutea.AAC.3
MPVHHLEQRGDGIGGMRAPPLACPGFSTLWRNHHIQCSGNTSSLAQASFGGRRGWLTMRTLGLSIPIPNATVATTTCTSSLAHAVCAAVRADAFSPAW